MTGSSRFNGCCSDGFSMHQSIQAHIENKRRGEEMEWGRLQTALKNRQFSHESDVCPSLTGTMRIPGAVWWPAPSREWKSKC